MLELMEQQVPPYPTCTAKILAVKPHDTVGNLAQSWFLAAVNCGTAAPERLTYLFSHYVAAVIIPVDT